MCGIVAIFSTSGRIAREQLLSATRALAHRGPDGEGIWISENKNVGLGHRRLSIVDPRGGKQPIVSHDGNIVATVNGELYDYKKIRSALQAKGHIFRTQSDSEIALYLYQEYGLNFVDYLRGEFALVLYDKRKNRIIAARDRFGIKPLQYHLDAKGILYIASEAKAIFASGVKAVWDKYALYHSCSLQYVPQDRTLFKDIYQLKPGHILIYDGAKLTIKKYWDLDFPKESDEKFKKYDENKIAGRLEDLLQESVALRLQTDGAKYCSHLSGGIDSAMVAALAARLGNQKLRCFTVSFPHGSYDETELAKSLASYIGAEFTPVVVGAADIVETISDAVYYSEGMAINSHLAAKYILNKEIKKAGYEIALTGEGSDESLAGYIHLRADLLGGMPEEIKQSEGIVGGVHLPSGQSLDLEIIKEKLGYIPTFLQAKGSIGHVMNNLLSPAFKEYYSADKIVVDFINSVDIRNQLKGRHKVNQSSYLWIKFTLANYILKTLGDGTEMANSIEGRVPFLDHKFFEFVRTIPMSLKIKNDIQKYILRKIARKYIPKEIYERPKQAFMAPPLSLLRDKRGINFIHDSFNSRAFGNMGFFDQKKVNKLIDGLPDMEMKQQIALEPAIMLMLSAFLIHKRFQLSS